MSPSPTGFIQNFEHGGWELCIPNLAALDASDVMITLGGRLTVSLMGQLAADKERPVLAIPSFGGTSTEIYESLKFTYRRNLKDGYHELSLLKSPWRDGFAEKVMDLGKVLAQNKSAATPHSYFLSYVWENSEFADHVEVLLYRFRRAVNRDERIFAAGVDLSDVVKSFIDESDTFIALYNEQYTKSTWCPQEARLRSGPTGEGFEAGACGAPHARRHRAADPIHQPVASGRPRPDPARIEYPSACRRGTRHRHLIRV